MRTIEINGKPVTVYYEKTEEQGKVNATFLTLEKAALNVLWPNANYEEPPEDLSDRERFAWRLGLSSRQWERAPGNDRRRRRRFRVDVRGG